MDLSVPYSGKWPNDVWVPDFESDDEEDVMLLGDFGEADDVDEADDDGGDEDGEEGDDGDDDDEDSPDEDEIERFCQSSCGMLSRFWTTGCTGSASARGTSVWRCTYRKGEH